jgi:hypothetical protein
MGSNAFEAAIDSASSPARPEATRRRGRMVSVGVTLEVALLERARNAVFWTPGLTLTDIANCGFALALGELEQDHGAPFPARTGQVRVGRPVRATDVGRAQPVAGADPEPS